MIHKKFLNRGLRIIEIDGFRRDELSGLSTTQTGSLILDSANELSTESKVGVSVLMLLFAKER